MGGTGDATLKRGLVVQRFDWSDEIVQKDMLQTLQAIRSEEAKAAALRALTGKFMEIGKPEIALSLATNVATQGRSSSGAMLKAMQLAFTPSAGNNEVSKDKEDPNQIHAPDLSNELTDTVSRVAYTEAHALKGEYAKALEIANFKGPSCRAPGGLHGRGRHCPGGYQE